MILQRDAATGYLTLTDPLDEARARRDAERAATDPFNPPPTEQELSEQYLLAHDWTKQDFGGWTDSIGETDHTFEHALEIQNAREMRDAVTDWNEAHGVECAVLVDETSGVSVNYLKGK